MLKEEDFRRIVLRVIMTYRLSPEAAAQLLQRIIRTLEQRRKKEET